MIAVKHSVKLPEWHAKPGESLRKYNEVAKEGLREEADLHHRRNIPRHFKQEARSRYNYAPRSTGYFKFKLRSRGQARSVTDETGQKVQRTIATNAHLDLIRTGDTMRKVMAARKIIASGSGNRVSVRLQIETAIPGGRTGRDLDAAAIARILASGKRIKFIDRQQARAKQDTNRRTIAEIERLHADEVAQMGPRLAARFAHKYNTQKTVKVK